MIDYMSIGLFLLALSLGSWISFADKKYLAKISSAIFSLAAISYVGLMVLQDWSLPTKLLTLSRDAFFISGFAVLIMMVRKVKILPFIILLCFGFNINIVTDYFKSNTPFKLGPSKAKITTDKVYNELSGTAELLVELSTKNSLTELNQLKTEYDLNIDRAFFPENEGATSLDEYYTIDIPDIRLDEIEQIIEALNGYENVRWVEPNEILQLDVITSDTKVKKHKCNHVNDPLDAEQWMHQALEMDKYYGLLESLKSSTKKRAKLFILDSGVDAAHEDLKDNYVSLKSQFDKDENGHGTHCAGVAAASTNNGKGIASFSIGKNYTSVTGIKVVNSMGFGTQKQTIDGIIMAVDNGADVISLSLGGISNQLRQEAYDSAVQYATDKGCIVVVAAGNSDKDAAKYSPANANGVIAVAAIDEALNKAAFSNSVQNIEFSIAAPGVNIISSLPNNKYNTLTGTSMACPHVAGLIAVMKSLKPSLTHEQAYQILEKSGLAISDSDKTGKLIQPYKAIKLVVQDMLN